jgi:hypothetical protein
MGGMIIIISPEWAKLQFRSRAEKSGLGLIAKLKFSSGRHQIRFIGAYIPPRSGKTGYEPSRPGLAHSSDGKDPLMTFFLMC